MSQTTAAMEVFVLAMVLYPNVMRKAQAEIDAVVGRSRLPNFSDRASLPYVGAIVKEVWTFSNIVDHTSDIVFPPRCCVGEVSVRSKFFIRFHWWMVLTDLT